MNWSLNELDAMARKATRGAGYSWGLAEEAGRATRWLAAAGLPGPMCLARLLADVDGADFKDFTPAVSAGRCTADSGALCPLLTGVALCDGALDYSPLQGLTLSNLSAPLLLLPFVAQTFGIQTSGTQSSGVPTSERVRLRWAEVQIILEHGAVYLDGVVGDLTCTQAQSVTLDPAPAEKPPQGAPLAPQSRAVIDVKTRTCLEEFAQRTFAPATEASRLAGAGAGLSDND